MTREDYLDRTRKKHKAMIADFNAGMSAEDIQKKYNYATLGAVRYVLRKHGKDPETPGRWGDRPLDVPKVLALMRAHWPIRDPNPQLATPEEIERVRAMLLKGKGGKFR